MNRHLVKSFQENVPVYDYSKIYKEWWYKTLEGKPDICWPGKIKYYALSSGTSESASKYIPVTNDLLRGNRIVMIRQLLSLRNYLVCRSLPQSGAEPVKSVSVIIPVRNERGNVEAAILTLPKFCDDM